MNRTGIFAGTARWLRAHGAALVIGTGLAAVSAVTGFISYTHICALTLSLHQSWKTAHLMPVAVDGQIVIGSVVLMAATGRNRLWGLVGIVPGLAESLFANWESGISTGLLDASWATVAAQAFAVSSFLFERWLKMQAVTLERAVRAVPANDATEAACSPSRDAAPDAAGTLSPARLLVALANSDSLRNVAALTGTSKTTVARWRKLPAGDVPVVPDAPPGVAEASLNGSAASA